MSTVLNKSDLIQRLSLKAKTFSEKEVEDNVKLLIDKMADTLATGRRIEIRGFGSFCLNRRAPRLGRNPKTGESVQVSAKHVPHFKPGKSLREEVNASAGK